MNIRHNKLIALRSFKRYRNTFLINIVGLTSGMICILFCFLWINDELKIDRFHEKTDQLYEVMKNIHFNGQIQTDNYTPYRLAFGLKSEMLEVLASASFYDFDGEDSPKGVLSNDDKQFILRPALISVASQLLTTDGLGNELLPAVRFYVLQYIKAENQETCE